MSDPNILNFQDYFEFSKNKIHAEWIPTDFMYERCHPNTVEGNITGISKRQLNNIRKTSMRHLPTFAIEYFNFIQFDSDHLPEKIALLMQTLPLVPIKYDDVLEFAEGYYQAELNIKATDKDVLVYPHMIDFERYNTPLSISKTAIKTPLFKLNKGDYVHIHFYISKGVPVKNVRWTSVTTFIFESNNINHYSEDFHVKIETNGSIDPITVFEKSVDILDEQDE